MLNKKSNQELVRFLRELDVNPQAILKLLEKVRQDDELQQRLLIGMSGNYILAIAEIKDSSLIAVMEFQDLFSLSSYKVTRRYAEGLQFSLIEITE